MASMVTDSIRMAGILKKKEGHRSAMQVTKWVTKWVVCEDRHIMYWKSEESSHSEPPKKRIDLEDAKFFVEPTRFEIVLKWHFEESQQNKSSYTLDFRCADDADYERWEQFFEGILGAAEVVARRESVIASPMNRLSFLGTPRRSMMSSRPPTAAEPDPQISRTAEDAGDGGGGGGGGGDGGDYGFGGDGGDGGDYGFGGGDNDDDALSSETDSAEEEEPEPVKSPSSATAPISPPSDSAEASPVAEAPQPTAAERAAAGQAELLRRAGEEEEARELEQELKMQELNAVIDRNAAMATRIQAARRKQLATAEVEVKRQEREERKAIEEAADEQRREARMEHARNMSIVQARSPRLYKLHQMVAYSQGINPGGLKGGLNLQVDPDAKHHRTILHSGWLYKKGKYSFTEPAERMDYRFFVLQNSRPGTVELFWFESDVLKAHQEGGEETKSLATPIPARGVVNIMGSKIEQGSNCHRGHPDKRVRDPVKYPFMLKARAGIAHDLIVLNLFSTKSEDREKWFAVIEYVLAALETNDKWLSSRAGPPEDPWTKKKKVMSAPAPESSGDKLRRRMSQKVT
jgi:hypothetical protein